MPPVSGMPGKTAADTGLIARPKLAPHFQCHAIDDQQVFLVSESFNTLLHGKIYSSLLPLLDGCQTRSNIIDSLSDEYSEAEVSKALTSLTARGYVVSGDYQMVDGRAAFWTALGATPCWAEERLSAASVTVSGDVISLTSLVTQLQGMGITVLDEESVGGIKPEMETPALAVVFCNDYLDEHLESVNRRHIESGMPWMLIRPGGLQPLFGPVFRPAEQGACWCCLAYRLQGHQEVHNFLRNLTGDNNTVAPRAIEPAVAELICSLAAVEIAKWLLLGKNASLHNAAISLDTDNLKVRHHRVMRRPQCIACGDENLFLPDRQPLPVQLQSSPNKIRNSGGLRSVSPKATLAKYSHLVDPISGVVTWLKRTTDNADPWLHVHWAGSNIALKNRALSVLRLSLRTKSAGKGSTPLQSEASALCEALERYSGAFHGDEIRLRKRFRDFASGEAIQPNQIQLFSEEQLDNAAQINDGGHPYNVVPPRLDPEAEVDWTPVWSLTAEQHRYIPTSLLYFGKSIDPRGETDFVADSNGCAAGNTLEEAILQGFFELVERDAFAVWWYNRLNMPGVDLDSFNDGYLSNAREYYHGLKRELWLLDVTSDFNIPTLVALSRRTDKSAEDIIYGVGTHTDPHIAALRAVCEMNQFLNWVQGTGPGGAGYSVDDPQCLDWWRNATLAGHPYLAAATDIPLRGKSHYTVPDSVDLCEDVEHCRALVEAKGMEFMVLDQTRPDIGLPVARVIVPGMRHFWERYAPGRLFEVPVTMGWRKTPLNEAELNPAPVIG